MRDNILNLLIQLFIVKIEILFGHLRLLKSKDLGGTYDDIFQLKNELHANVASI